MIELTVRDGALRQGFGGDTLNTAVYLARQMDPEQFRVCYVTGLGRDPFSAAMTLAWRAEGIDTDHIVYSDKRLPGMYYIETAADGERHFYYWRGEAAARFWMETPQGREVCRKLTDFDVLYVSGISLAILEPKSRSQLFNTLSACREKGGRIFFDNNYRPSLWPSREEAQQVYRRMLGITDTAFLTLDDEAALWGTASLIELHNRCDQAGVREVVIKRGQASCLIMKDVETLEIPAVRLEPESVKDTTAAGDSFSAGYMAARLLGGDVEDSARQGHLLASIVIQYPGAIIPADAMPLNV